MSFKITSSRTALTFDEWVENGYRVKKGEKSSGRNKDNKATFTLKQVWFVPEDKRDQYLSETPQSPPKEIVDRIHVKVVQDENKHNFMAEDFDPSENDMDDIPF